MKQEDIKAHLFRQGIALSVTDIALLKSVADQYEERLLLLRRMRKDPSA